MSWAPAAGPRVAPALTAAGPVVGSGPGSRLHGRGLAQAGGASAPEAGRERTGRGRVTSGLSAGALGSPPRPVCRRPGLSGSRPGVQTAACEASPPVCAAASSSSAIFLQCPHGASEAGGCMIIPYNLKQIKDILGNTPEGYEYGKETNNQTNKKP